MPANKVPISSIRLWQVFRKRHPEWSTNHVVRVLADIEPYHPNTIRCHLAPEYRHKQNARKRVYGALRRALQRYEKQYHRAYKRLIRGPSQQRILASVYAAYPEEKLTLEQIANVIRQQNEIEGIQFDVRVIETRLLQPYMMPPIRGPPYLARDESGQYLLTQVRSNLHRA